MREALLVGAGGFLGAIARYGVGWLARRIAGAGTFPWGTLAANLIGCFVIGLVLGRSEIHGTLGAQARAFAVVGFLGGFTTFSSYGYETFAFIRHGQAGLAFAYAAGSIVLGLGAVALGWWIGAK